MTGQLWLPGAERVPGPHAAGSDMAGGASRVVHHITWDALDAHGGRPAFDSTRNYLVQRGFEPTLMIDPILGRSSQFLPANRSAYAMQHPAGMPETNRRGSACIQVEWFFSPGCVVNGVRYNDLTETPMHGLAELLAMAESWGIPPVWPLGEPVWSGASRDARTWTGKAGHYGHCHAPANNHTDPGPLRLGHAPNVQEDIVATLDELRTVIKEEVAVAVKQLHADHILLLHGDATHPNSLDSIAKASGVKQP